MFAACYNGVMEHVNHYAAFGLDAPPSRPPRESLGDIWRDGRLLVVSKDAVLPERCVKCNAPDEGRRLMQSLSWIDPTCNQLPTAVLLIVYFFVRQRAKIEFGICRRHRRLRRYGIAVGYMMIFMCAVTAIILAKIVAAGGGIGVLVIALFFSVLLLLCGGVACVVISETPLSVNRMDKERVWLEGAAAGFLAQFPPFQG